ncbi:MAG: 4-hydroxybenzoyl-CoA thioesterase [Planctomycetaceae bacterium]|nr:4-hydroxybenzoyl-CoA thioesterase [Planctomycetaceae bacterium]|tara:strand:+ start:61 stop:501 length:441 start_codon:yes stop_codon:yes gene_type:complete
MSQVFTTIRRVEFRDTDAAGIMHFSAYFTYMEEAEHELLRSIGTSVVLDAGPDTVSWPRVAAKAEYRGPVRFEDEMSIEVRIKRIGSRSVTYHHTFLVSDQTIATGEITAVCCRIQNGQKPTSREIPEDIRESLESFVDLTLSDKS